VSAGRTLVTAASRHEATMEIATEICAELRRRGLRADARPIEEVSDLEGYSAVVLGSAIYAGRWLAPALAFVDLHREQLAARPLWLFSSGPVGDPPVPADRIGADLVALIESTGAREHRVFPGRLDRHELGLMERAVVSLVHAPDGDYRPWPEIVEWADTIAASLTGPGPS
jgi:menaquinone-dependent protoporphyrinogen oxidase